MVRHCHVCGKSSGKDSNISFHRFPRQITAQRNWLTVLHIDPTQWIWAKSKVVCSKHFRPEDFINLQGARLRLKSNVVPSVLLEPIIKKTKAGTTNIFDVSLATNLGVNFSSTIDLAFSAKSDSQNKPLQLLEERRFPSIDLEKQNIWFSLLGFDENHRLPKRADICSDHFDPSDIVVSESGLRAGTRFIKSGANPKLHDSPQSDPSAEEAYSITQQVESNQNSTEVIKFPSKLEDRNVWFALVGFDENKRLPKNPDICSDHFDPSDIVVSKSGLRAGLRYVRPGAHPKLHDPPQSDLSTGAYSSDSTTYETPPKKPRIETSDPMQDNIVIKIEDGSSTDSAEESNIITEPVNLLRTALSSKSSLIPTQAQVMTMPLDRNTLKNDLVADEAEQQAEFIARRTLEKNKEKLSSFNRKNRLLKRKIEKINKIFEELGKQCDIREVSKQLSNIPSNSSPVAEDSSTESDVEEPCRLNANLEDNIKVNVVTKKKPVVTAAAQEEEATQINCHNMESQVQVTFLAGSDTAKEGLLKRKLKQLAENDVIKSKKIRELHNIVFVKNKLINELKSEIAQLKEFQKKQIQRPVIQYIVRKN